MNVKINQSLGQSVLRIGHKNEKGPTSLLMPSQYTETGRVVRYIFQLIPQ